MVKHIDLTGLNTALILLDNGMPIKEIARHETTAKRFSCHVLAKKYLLKNIRDDPTIRLRIHDGMIFG